MLFHTSQIGKIKILEPRISNHNIPLIYFSDKRENVLVHLSNAVEKVCKEKHFKFNGLWHKMDEIQFKKEYQGCGLFTELYHYLTTIISAQTKYVDAFARKENLKSQRILEHLGLAVVGESKNGKSLYFKGEYKTLFKRYSV